MTRLAVLVVALLCSAFALADATRFGGRWQNVDDAAGDFVEIRPVDGAYTFTSIAFSVFSQSMQTRRFPASQENAGVLSVQAGPYEIPILHESSSDTLTIEGTRTYRRIEEDIESAAESWASARADRIAGNAASARRSEPNRARARQRRAPTRRRGPRSSAR